MPPSGHLSRLPSSTPSMKDSSPPSQDSQKKLEKKHLPKSEQTHKCHMDQERRNLQSTQPKQKIKVEPSKKITLEPSVRVKIEPDEIGSNANTCTNLFICAIVRATNKNYSDLTGKFPMQSALGNKYVLIVYHYDANAIIAEPLKNRTAG